MKSAEISDKANQLIYEELIKAEKKFPGWPRDVIHGVAIIAEELGESTQAALKLHFGDVGLDEGKEHLIIEVAQTGAMALRMLFSLLDERAYPEQEENAFKQREAEKLLKELIKGLNFNQRQELKKRFLTSCIESEEEKEAK